MQQSMTGYGREERRSQQFRIKTEIKTLNSKFLDFSPRLPKELTSRETEVRNQVTERLKRGKVMLSVELTLDTASGATNQVDEQLFKAYFEKFQQLATTVKSKEDNLLQLAIQAPDVIKPKELSEEDLPWEDIQASLDKALEECIRFRKQEGQVLAEKLLQYILNIENSLEQIHLANERRDDAIRTKLRKSIDDVREKVKLDQNRFEQELIFYLERLDISEEKVRLKQHLDYFRETITSQECAGKKLGFISQEIGREINTIGSKANDAQIQKIVVNMKDELEKIKEQVLNLI